MAKNEQAKATTHAVRPRSRRTAKNAPNQAPPRVAMAKPNRQPESTARAPPESNGYPKASSVKLAMAPRAPTRASPTGLPSRERTKPGRHHPGPLAPRAAKKAAEKTRNAARATRISCQPMASRSMAAVPRALKGHTAKKQPNPRHSTAKSAAPSVGRLEGLPPFDRTSSSLRAKPHVNARLALLGQTPPAPFVP